MKDAEAERIINLIERFGFNVYIDSSQSVLYYADIAGCRLHLAFDSRSSKMIHWEHCRPFGPPPYSFEHLGSGKDEASLVLHLNARKKAEERKKGVGTLNS